MCQITKFDMGFQKNNIRSRSEKVDYFKNNFFTQIGTKFNYGDNLLNMMMNFLEITL